jgi:hypothetical protein
MPKEDRDWFRQRQGRIDTYFDQRGSYEPRVQPLGFDHPQLPFGAQRRSRRGAGRALLVLIVEVVLLVAYLHWY